MSAEERDTTRQLGVQEPPSDPMIYNRRQPDGIFRSLTGFFEDKEENVTTEERDTKIIESEGGAEMLYCRDCGSYRSRGGGLGTCHVFTTPFGGDSTPVCGSFVPPIPEPRDTTTIAGKFAEALGYLEEAVNWLEQVNAEYDPAEHADDIRLVVDYGLRPCNPAVDFWLQADLAEDPLRTILRRLQRVQPLVPKEVTA